MNEQHQALRKISYQIEYAINNYKPHGLSANNYSNLVIGGLGGSGIGGQIAKALFASEFPIPVECIADYNLPEYVNNKSLVILASYSGNTEETLTMYEETKKRGAKMLILSTGGKLKEMATADSLYFLQVESGFQPRMALGFSLTFLVQIFGELIGKAVTSDLKAVAAELAETSGYESRANDIFEIIKNRIKTKFIVLSDGPMAPVAIRFAQQVQENAKHECFQHVIPEMNHNVIESYYGTLDSVFFFINSGQNERINSRFEFMDGLLAVENHKVIHIAQEGFTLLSVFETIFLLDWVSLYVADQRRVDSLNVPNIASLKSFLEQVN